MFHCFGIGDEILKFNLYGNNTTYKLEDNLKFTSKRKNYINFNEIGNGSATVYQYKIDSNSTSFISGTLKTDGTKENAGLAFTAEANVILPNRVSIAEYHTVKEGYSKNTAANYYPLVTQASIFGMHSADITENELTWPADDFANFQVYTIKDDQYSSNAYFKLTGTAGGFIPALTSSLIEDVYNDQMWTIAVTVEPEKYPLVDQVNGTNTTNYTVRFYGVNYIADYKAQEFLVTGTMTNAQGRRFLSSRKRFYAGAHRTNFTGSRIDFTDVKVNSCKAWFTSIPTGTIDNHNLKIGNYGSPSATQNDFLYQTSINSINVPESQTLAFLWDFTKVTGSDANGQFSVEDETSGSLTDNRFSWFSDLVSRRHTASGSFFETSSTNVVQALERGTYQSQVPEVLLDSNLTRILSQDDEFFNRNTRPVTYHMSIEKNLFQGISENMLDMFGSVVWFNNLIGTPVNVYRGDYKELKKAADMYFEKVKNDYDFDKYVEYFKFIDYAVSRYIAKLIPASMLTFEDGVMTVIENFVLGDRNKFASKYPLIKDVKPKEIIGEALGINELLYDWEYGHAPLSNKEKDNCLWWNERAERTNSVIKTSDAGINNQKQTLLDSEINETNAPVPILAKSSSSGIQTYSGSVYVTRRLARPYKTTVELQPVEHGGTNFNLNRRIEYWRNKFRVDLKTSPYVDIAYYDASASCDDKHKPNAKSFVKYKFDGYKDRHVSFFNVLSSSTNMRSNTTTASVGVVGVGGKYQITNIHYDAYGVDSDTPMQGPFSDTHIGGSEYRHIPMNTGSDNATNRAEFFRISATPGNDVIQVFGSDANPNTGLVDPHIPRADYYREETAKRPINVKNIKSTTGSLILGNYSQNYEIVLTNGRSTNNRFLAESAGDILTASSYSTFISGIVEYRLPRRDLTGSNQSIIVNRFSAPGDAATMCEGMLDVASGEYSVYNVLPFRNLSVRLPLVELESDHCEQFGYFSDWFTKKAYELADETYPFIHHEVNKLNYSGSASFQKVNRNTRRYLGYTDIYTGKAGRVKVSESFDNAYVQHPIPQTDVQYSWISASLSESYSGLGLYGYEPKDLSVKDYASSVLTFISQSDYVSVFVHDNGWRFGYDYKDYLAHAKAIPGTDEIQAGKYIFTPFNHMITNVKEPITSSLNLLGYSSASLMDSYLNKDLIPRVIDGIAALPSSGEASLLNAVLLSRHGPYGGANWKLYRKEFHPIVMQQRRKNVYTVQNYAPLFASADDSGLPAPFFEKGHTPRNFVEPPVTSKFKPLQYTTPGIEKGGTIGALGSLGNIHSHYTNHTQELINTEQYSKASLDNLLAQGKSHDEIKNTTFSPYLAFKTQIENTKDLSKVQVIYSETVYPKGLYTYLSGSRKRINFINKFWRDDRSNRTLYTYDNSCGDMGSPQITASLWKLDAHDNFTDSLDDIPYSAIRSTMKNGTGELQNSYCLFHYGSEAYCYPATNYNRRIKLILPGRTANITAATAFNNKRKDIHPSWLPYADGIGLETATAPARFSASVGDTLWEASSSTGEKPFYDSYDDYAEEGFRNLKEGTIIPEFRMSQVIDEFVVAGTELQYNNYNPFEFFGKDKKSSALTVAGGLLELTGASIDGNVTTEISSFLNRYTFSDFYKYFKFVQEDWQDERPLDTIPEGEKINTTKHKLVCDAILKFLPYDGFYPSERCVQLGTIFSQSLGPYAKKFLMRSGQRIPTLNAKGNLRTLMQPYMAPGVLFNAIKSGIAVDYPVFTKKFLTRAQSLFTVAPSSSVCWGSASISGNFDRRINFTDLVEPRFQTIIDAELDPDMSLNSTASIKNIDSRYTFAISNFLAGTMGIFTGKAGRSQLYSSPFESTQQINVPSTGIYKMNIVLKNSTNISTLADFQEATASMLGAAYSNDYTNHNAISSSGFPYITSSFQVNTSSITMYSRANTGYNTNLFLYGSSFGPPVECGMFASGSLQTPIDNQFVTPTGNLAGTSFDPFTPSYYNGFSKVEISVPLTASVDYDINTILNDLTYSYDRLNTFLYPTTKYTGGEYSSIANAMANARHTTAYRHAMQLSASWYLGDGEAGRSEIIFERTRLRFPTNPDSTETTTEQIVAFKPRWECPVLDFSDITPTPSYVTGNVSKGMWHQSGTIPAPGRGISYQILQDQDYNLTKILNISPKQASMIGKIKGATPEFDYTDLAAGKKKKQFSEAIIAVPYKYNNNTKETIPYRIDEVQLGYIKDNLFFDKEQRFDPTSPIRTYTEIESVVNGHPPNPFALQEESRALYNLLIMMRKYVLPPHFDFLHNPAIDPFVMFMMEFSVDINENDLKNIWQNIEPTFGKKAFRVSSETNFHLMPTTADQSRLGMKGDAIAAKKVPFHPYFGDTMPNGLYTGDVFNPEKTRWAVFKVKQRAPMNYNKVIGTLQTMGGDPWIRRDKKGTVGEFLYSYNWPYDFFSLVELGKVTSITTFNPNYDELGDTD